MINIAEGVHRFTLIIFRGKSSSSSAASLALPKVIKVAEGVQPITLIIFGGLDHLRCQLPKPAATSALIRLDSSGLRCRRIVIHA